MNEESQDLIFDLKVMLLEDLHSGTGTGNVTVDAVQTRNEEGYAIIDRHHFRGVLRDNALRLVSLNAIDEDDVTDLFGQPGDKQRKLDCPSLVATKKDCFIHWDATARQKGSRCPEDNSLRRKEYIRSGTELTGKIHLEQVTEKQINTFNTILKFTSRLGAERTRGSGQIKITHEIVKQKNNYAIDLNSTATTVRLLLKNLEPLCIPTEGHSGNIIRSESHIPGRTLFAAIASQAFKKKENIEQFKKLFSEDLIISPAYPVPSNYIDEDKKIENLVSRPMPNHIHQRKSSATGMENGFHWPHWAKPTSSIDSAPTLTLQADSNIFSDEKKDKTERPKGEMYLFYDQSGTWRRYQQPLSIRMRNRRGHPLNDTLKVKDTDLFSEQRIPANTQFLCDLYCKDNSLLKDILHWAKNPSGLRIGRGKAPVVLQEWSVITTPSTPDLDTDVNELIINASSDWIIRGFNLGYLNELDKHTFLSVFNVEQIEEYNDLSFEAVQESEEHGGFNFATRLPRRPVIVIKRGSVFRFKINSDNPENKEALLNLHTALAQRAVIGERTREGYGLFDINLPITMKDQIEIDREIQLLKAEQERKLEAERMRKEKEQEERRKEELKNMQSAMSDYSIRMAEEYYKVFYEKAKAILNELNIEDWLELKKQLLQSEPNQYSSILTTKKASVKNVFYDVQGSNNLSQFMCQKLDESQRLPDVFLEHFQSLLFGEGEK